MIEYAVVLGVVLAVSIGAFLIIGTRIDLRFRDVSTGLCATSVGC